MGKKVEISFTKQGERGIIKMGRVCRQHTCGKYPERFFMVFSNLFFLYIFLPALFLAYFIIKNDTYRRGVLVAFSLFFYAWGEPVYVFLMIGMVLADYIFGLLIHKCISVTWKSFWLVLAIITNLAILGLYKYLGFFTDTINTIYREINILNSLLRIRLNES